MTNIELCEAVRELPDEIQAVRLVYGDHERNTLLDVADLKRWATDYERLLAAAKMAQNGIMHISYQYSPLTAAETQELPFYAELQAAIEACEYVEKT